jgi:hypothetical protein
MSEVLDGDLHDYLDRVQIQLSELAGSIGRAFFRDWKPESAGVAAPLQSQTM